jgi:hypothetical protein
VGGRAVRDDPTERVEFTDALRLHMSPPRDEDGDRDDVDEPSSVEFDPPTGTDAANGDEGTESGRGGGTVTPSEESADASGTTSESLRRTLDDLLPEASVDSKWWYWIAAVPLYFVVTLVGGAVAAGLFVFAGLLDVVGFGGLASLSTFVLLGGVAALFGLVGVAIAFAFPVAMYVDARAVEREGREWTPDPVLWGLLAVVAVLVTNFVVSVPLALYYLYRRHEELGTP